MRQKLQHSLIAGWISFACGLATAWDSLSYMSLHNTQGSTVALGFATAFLSFAAAAFGISGYERRHDAPGSGVGAVKEPKPLVLPLNGYTGPDGDNP